MISSTIPESVRTRIADAKWFTEGEFLWRTGASVAWLLLFLPVALLVFSAVALVDFLHPLTWIADTLGHISSHDFWLTVMIYGAILIIVNVSTARFRLVRNVVHKTRIAAILFPLHPLQLCHIVLCTMAGAASLWCCTTIADYPTEALTEHKEELDSVYYLNEHLLFIVLYGAWLGFFTDSKFFTNKDFHFSFPRIQQRKFFQIKAAVVPSIKQAVVSALKACRWYYVIYYVIGNIPRDIIANNLGASLDTSNRMPLNSFWGLLDFSLFWFLFASGSLVHFLWIFGHKLFVVFNTQPYRFPIESSITQDKDQTLPVVIKNRTVPLLKYLAMLDLCQLSQFNPSRRKQIFSLSQPGGRPANWTDISDECLSIIRFLSNELSAEISHQTQLRQPAIDPRLFGSVLGINGEAHKTRADTPLQSPVPFHSPQTTVTHRHWVPEETVQLWSASGDTEPSLPAGTSGETQSAPGRPGDAGIRRFVSWVRDEVGLFYWKMHQIPHTVACFLKERSIIGFLFNEIPESRTQTLFIDCQLHIWAVEGLSRLVVASFTEDTFGVVQKTLPDILVALLDLLQALDTYSKLLVTTSSKPAIQPRPPRPQGKDGLRYQLRTALVSAIYRITSKFHGHLNGIQLSPEHCKRLQSFVEYRE